MGDTEQTRIIFLTMIKNESKIIKRCIESALPVADAVCVCDTGSTDTTVDVLSEYFQTLKVPAKIYTEGHEWRNFGHNRTQSFKSAQAMCAELGWNPAKTYALVLDADMQLRPQPSFQKSTLTAIGYRMIQKSSSLEYYNTRFLQLSHPWKCTGVTHEYWDGGETQSIGMQDMYILDVGDGGCKADKFTRDIRLLEEGLAEDPKNARYMFYLAQSYKDTKQLEKSIEMYKKRIEAGGWFEEIWYSMYVIMKLYAELGKSAEMEYWGLKAYEFRKERSENLLFLTRYFRDRRQHHKAWHYWELGHRIQKPNDLLFLETDVYERAFDYERAILHDYVHPERKSESMKYSLDFFNKHGDACAYSNIQWFVQKIPAVSTRALQIPQLGDFVPTSTCFIRKPDSSYVVNVRYVNYRIQPNGSYLMSENGKLSGDHAVRTENYVTHMNSNFEFIGPLMKLNVAIQPTNSARIQGLEDLRLFYDANSKLKFIATTSEYSYDHKIRQHIGSYNLQTLTLEDSVSVRPPTYTDCEKNWIPYKGDKFIYKWHPFEIGRINEATNTLEIVSSQETPKFLSHMRGSSTLVRDGEFFYGITHCVIYQTPRKYYHMIVKIHADSNRLVAYTDPFYFQRNAIEYCLGYTKEGKTHTVIVSQNDANPILVTFEGEHLVWHFI